MKLERLQLEKFKDNALKKEQMVPLGGRNVITNSGSRVGPHSIMGITHYNYGYDVDRYDGDTYNGTTYHNRTLVHPNGEPCQYK